MLVAKKQGGFTIIEVIIFLAISGLLLSIALLGTGTTIRSVRFTDSAKSFHSFIQGQYDEILNGVNPRAGQEACANSLVNPSPATPEQPGASKCLLLGKYLVLTEGLDTVKSYYVVGSEPASVPANATDEKLIELYNPYVASSVQLEDYRLPWGALISGAKRQDAYDGKKITGYALLRSPRSSRIVSYTFPGAVPANGRLTAIVQDPTNIQKPSNICILSADNLGSPAKITIAAGQGQDAVTLTFDALSTDCVGV
jgi:type II secretory pathway pseudopilin PulG